MRNGYNIQQIENGFIVEIMVYSTESTKEGKTEEITVSRRVCCFSSWSAVLYFLGETGRPVQTFEEKSQK